jgi:rhodanese-related sulfurtransferase
MNAMSTAPIWKTSAVTLLVAAAGLIAASASPVQAQAAMPAATVAASELPKGKQTTLGLYVTAAQAYEMWKAAPDKVKIIDVRTPEEFAFVGHPEMAWNIPLAFATYERKDGKFQYAAKPNTAFVAQVREVAKPNDVLLVTCRSGGRGAMAVNQLAAAGFTKAYNIVDGIEGDAVKDPQSVFNGKRMKNGWKNSAPWVYDIDPEKVILEEGAATGFTPKE